MKDTDKDDAIYETWLYYNPGAVYKSIFGMWIERNGESTGRQAASAVINGMLWLMGFGFTPCGENLAFRSDA